MLPISSLTLFAALASHAAGPPSPSRGAQADTAIARIRREYAEVNAMLPGCQRRTQDVFGESLEGGTMKVYRCGGAIRKIVVTYYGETGQATKEWYLSGDRPFFLYVVDTRYDQPFGRVAGRSEERVYWAGERVIRWLDAGRARATGTPEARERLGELRAEIADLLDRARTGRTDAN